MRIVDLELKEAERFLESRKQVFRKTKNPILVVGLEDEKGNRHGVFIAEREKKGIAALVHVYADGTPGGFSHLYGDAWRALKAMGYTFARL